MKYLLTWLTLLPFGLITLPSHAQSWEFSKPVEVTSNHGEKIFHHLESSGRQNIAVSADTIGIAWEDNRDTTPRIYLARKNKDKPGFSSEVKISGDGDAYEPSLVALGKNRFALAWEENAQVHLRIVTPEQLGPVIILGNSETSQPSLAYHDQQLFLVYSKREGRFGRIWMHQYRINGEALELFQRCVVDSKPAKDEQLYPSIARLPGHVVVAWEDRRPGHTIIMAAQTDSEQACHFGAPQRISEGKSSRGPFGKGHGVARVALARYRKNQLLAAWADKRDFREGYDIYGSHYLTGKQQIFGPNEKIQDSFGSVAQQWHTSVAGNDSGLLVVAWDDNRDGDANIMLSWLKNDSWSDDITVPGADGQGEQNHPTLSLDDEGRLHLAWVERSKIGGPTRIRYLFGQLTRH